MPNFFKKPKFIILIILGAIFLTTGAKCGSLPVGTTAGKPKPVSLQYWKVYEESSNIGELFAAYSKQHPQVTVNYRNFTAEEYANELLKAFAEDRGPDIFSIHTTWMRQYKNLLLPMPAQLSLQYGVVKGTIQKETFTETRSKNTLSLRDLKLIFPDVVTDNQVIDNQIYGLPLSIDSMVLYYNRDLLNNAGIVAPPKTWDEFRDQVVTLTKQDAKGNIIQAGAAIGTANNIDNSADILSLLMMQSGTPMANANGSATFGEVPSGYTRATRPAAEALNFYTSFASPAKQIYTWNNNMPTALSAFMTGKTAFFLGYAYNLPLIKAQAPKLNFEIAPAPQISSGAPINFAGYWAETVSKKTKYPDEAWNLVLFMATDSTSNKNFLANSRKPAALKEFVKEQTQDLELSAFATQLLTAKSWYKGNDAKKNQDIFKSMINQNLEGSLTTDQIIDLGVSKVNQTIQ